MAPSARTGDGMPRWLSRLCWLVGLWFAGVAGLGAAAWLLKALMRAVGFA
jgi:hypothetical protein